MSIEVMKRIKSLLQDTKMIDSHTISAVVAECDMAILAKQPATGEPVAWNSIQIASWIGSQLMHEPSMFERATVCKFVRSLGRHPTLLKHSPKLHPAPSVPADVALDCYDAGILNDFGGGNVEWWQDYIRAELGHAHDFYQSQIAAPPPAQATQAEVTDAAIDAATRHIYHNGRPTSKEYRVGIARAILALRPERVPMIARSLAEWHEDDGYAVWWAWNGDLRGWAGEPAYIGSPLCDDWPGYHTHWTAHPTQPIGITAQAKKAKKEKP